MNTKQKVYLAVGLALIAYGTWDSFREYARQIAESKRRVKEAAWWNECQNELYAEIHELRQMMDEWAEEDGID